MKSRLFFSIAALLLCMSWMFGGCDGNGGANPSSDEGKTKTTLEEQKIVEIQKYLNDVSNNGFLCNNLYSSPKDVNLGSVFYDGAGISNSGNLDWSEEEKSDVLAATHWEDYSNPPLKLIKTDIDAFLLKKIGISLENVSNGMTDFFYVDKYNAYYTMHGDTNYHTVDVSDAQLDEAGLYVVNYMATDLTDKYTVTLKKTDDGYRFVSNSKQ